MPRMRPLLVVFASILVGCSELPREEAPSSAGPSPSAITLVEEAGGIAVRCDGAPFTVYRHDGVPNPVLYPLLTASGVAVTRNWPLQQGGNEPHDHQHHRSVWFAHGDVDGVDFWTNKGRIEQDGAAAIDAATASIRTADRWLDPAGRQVASDARRYGFRAGADWRAVDIEVRIGGSAALHFGDTKEGLMALRLRPELCLTGKGATAHIRDSEGRRDGAVWGKRASWVAYTGSVGGKVVTVAMFDHPDNLRHPTWWHARDYGLLAANPFGQHDFEGGAVGQGDYTLAAGDSLRLCYCIHLHDGAADDRQLAAAYDDWLAAVRRR